MKRWLTWHTQKNDFAKEFLPQAFLPNPQAFFPDTQAFFPVLWFYTEFSQRITYQIRIIFVHLMKIVLC